MKVETLALLALGATSARAAVLGHNHRRHEHQRRDVAVQTYVEVVTATAPLSPPASSPASSPPAPSAGSIDQSSTSSNSESAANKGSGLGINYSPYKPGGCKSQDQVNSDFNQFNVYSLVRIYGTDCNQVSTVLNAAKSRNMKVFAGIYDITQASSEAQVIIDAVNGDWSSIDTVSVGNEVVNSKSGTVDQVVAAVNSVRTQLRKAGYNGPVVTVDTFVAIMANTELCQASDYVAATCHPYWDGGVTAAQGAQFVVTQTQNVKNKCDGKRTVIAESGWPHQGETNGQAVPSRQNQQTVVSGLKQAFSKDLFIFTAYDDTWKDPGPDGVEQFWGIFQ